jgi:hypothetical protein
LQADTIASCSPTEKLNNPLIDSGLQANVIDKVDFNGLFNGFAEQQILLRALPAPTSKTA